MKKIILVLLLSVSTIAQKSFGEGEGIFNNYVSLASCVITIPNIVFFGKNIYQINNPEKYKPAIPITGIVTGGLQILFGVVDIAAYYNFQSPPPMGFAYFDLAFGSATIISSIWNLATDHNPKSSPSSFNIFTFPAHDKTMGMGLSYSLRF